jgi:predicted nucleic-acid-binding protein
MKHIPDTNFILRYLLADNADMFAKTKEIFDKAKIGEISLIIEQTVFTEVVFVLSSFYKVPREKIALILSELLTYKGIKCEKEILIAALDCYTKHNIHIVDSILMAKSKATDTSLMTVDKTIKISTKPQIYIA